SSDRSADNRLQEWVRLESVAVKGWRFMTAISRVVCFSLITSLICFAGLMSAQSPDQEQNLFACKNGWEWCDRYAPEHGFRLLELPGIMQPFQAVAVRNYRSCSCNAPAERVRLLERMDIV